jgi:hypothetical protein
MSGLHQMLRATGLETFIDVLKLRPGDIWNPKILATIEVNKADRGKLVAGKTQGVETTVESPTQGRGESLVAQLDKLSTRPNNSGIKKFSRNIATSWASTSRSAAIQLSLAAALTSEQAQLQAIQQRKRARSMGAAGCATKDQDRADRAALG